METKQKHSSPSATLHRLLDMGETEIILGLGDIEPETAEAAESSQALQDIRDSMGDCRLCKLAPLRNKLVFGTGDPSADIMFVGEAPGAEEDKKGEPFVGRAGQLLDKIFAAMGLSRERGIYIANILKCRPPENRDPQPDEVEMCMPFLLRQIESISPRAICCLGRIAAQNLLGTDATLGKLRDRVHHFQVAGRDVPVIVTYHPAYLLRNPEAKKPVWEDMKTLMKIVGLEIPKGNT